MVAASVGRMKVVARGRCFCWQVVNLVLGGHLEGRLCGLNDMFCAKGHFTHKPRAVTMKLWEPKRECPKVIPRHLQNLGVWSRPSGVVWTHMWPGPPPNAISMNFYSCRSSHTIKLNKSTIVSVRNAVVSRFCVRPTYKRWFFSCCDHKRDSFDAM